MKKLKREDLDQEIFDLYDKYAHNRISRREFTERISVYAIGGITLPSLLQYLMPNYKAQQIPKSDARVKSEYIEYSSPKGAGTMKALIARPVESGTKLPGIIVVHENRGLNPHIEDVTRRAGLAGFLALGPDALTPLGGYPGTDDEGRTMQRTRDKAEMLEDFIAAFEYLKSHPECNGNIGVVGFCFGGWISNMMAVRVPGLKAAVPFYGRQPANEDVPAIQAPLLLHFGELDTRVNEGWPAYEAALKEHNKEYTAYIYANANHGFHNDTTPRFDQEAAELAWSRTITFFNEKLQN